MAKDIERTVTSTSISDSFTGPQQRLVGLEFGLLASINLDWSVSLQHRYPSLICGRFAVHDVKSCSIGAVYITILNLPRHMTFKRAWTILALGLPGPYEPSTLALNRILEPLVDDLKVLERGILAHIAGRATLAPVYLQVLFTASDMPATRKLTGSMSHAFRRPCNHCGISKQDIQSEKAYDWRSWWLPIRMFMRS
jgi:hypothetical protein